MIKVAKLSWAVGSLTAGALLFSTTALASESSSISTAAAVQLAGAGTSWGGGKHGGGMRHGGGMKHRGGMKHGGGKHHGEKHGGGKHHGGKHNRHFSHGFGGGFGGGFGWGGGGYYGAPSGNWWVKVIMPPVNPCPYYGYGAAAWPGPIVEHGEGMAPPPHGDYEYDYDYYDGRGYGERYDEGDHGDRDHADRHHGDAPPPGWDERDGPPPPPPPPPPPAGWDGKTPYYNYGNPYCGGVIKVVETTTTTAPRVIEKKVYTKEKVKYRPRTKVKYRSKIIGEKG